jgi:hypothetical protein
MELLVTVFWGVTQWSLIEWNISEKIAFFFFFFFFFRVAENFSEYEGKSFLWNVGIFLPCVCVRGGPNQPLHRDPQWSIVLYFYHTRLCEWS